MKAFALTRYGKTNSVAAVERAQPDAGDDDVLVQIHAASINPLDLKIRNGELKPLLPYTLPIVLGNDLAGVVVKTGPRVRGFTAGDAVFAKPNQDRIGAFAEYLALNENDVAPKPERLDMTEAASLPLVALTAWQALVVKARVQPGQKVLIHAGSGGLGSIAIQLAKHLGATVATTTSAKNVAWVTDLGADVVIDYKTQDVTAELSGYDLVLDTQGGATLEKSLQVLKPGGAVISVAGPPDPEFAREFGANWFLVQAMRALSFSIRRKAKKRSVTYSFLFMTANGEQLRELGALLDAGVVRPVIDRVFPFDDTLEALAYVESGRSKGKVVVTMTDEGQ
ncbi:MAG TPA: NADP-dependent oxidoreductase [Mycobacterium sp.]|jgi:NADPH:quinone reductase-like Zn-dependent oxidoreductase